MSLLSKTDREEAVTHAYVRAVAAKLGYVVAQQDFDRDGSDLQLRAGGGMLPTLDLQLKGCVNLPAAQSGFISYPLKQRNYDLLIGPTIVPRLLVVCGLPKDEMEWVRCEMDHLRLSQKAYWVSLKGLPENDNDTSTTVKLPEAQLLNDVSLPKIMEKIRRGEDL